MSEESPIPVSATFQVVSWNDQAHIRMLGPKSHMQKPDPIASQATSGLWAVGCQPLPTSVCFINATELRSPGKVHKRT